MSLSFHSPCDTDLIVFYPLDLKRKCEKQFDFQPPVQSSINEKNKVIPVIEEQLHFSKEWQETGRVRITKTRTRKRLKVPLEVQR